MYKFREENNHKLLSLVIARLLVDGKATCNEDNDEMEARQLVDRTIAFELLRDQPELFVRCAKRKREGGYYSS